MAYKTKKETIVIRRNQSRRHFLRNAAAASIATFAAPYVKAARSAGKLSLGIWDHWVPGVNAVLRTICEEWGNANGVEVTIDFITSIGNKLLLTAQAESRARTGHDVYSLPVYYPSMFRRSLEPVDDVVTDIISAYGPLAPSAYFLAQLDGVWRAAPSPTASPNLASVSRLDLYKAHAGVDLTEIFPPHANRDPELVNEWTYEAFLKAAEQLHLAGHPFGAAISPTPDGTNWLAALFSAYGAEFVNRDGEVSVNSNEVRNVLEYMSRLTQFMPDHVYAWDDASNNRFMISGKGSTTINPPSIWAVSNRDMPAVAEQLWHHDTPRGPKGSFRADAPFFWGVWNFSENISAGKDLLRYVANRNVVDQLVLASQGFDIPVIISHYQNNDIWAKSGPPPGTLYNYPARGDEKLISAGYPAPPEMASQIAVQGLYGNLVASVTQGGETFDDAISWAENELEGMMRG
ncbi:MAG TPA: carbohydrate ABC transporter substrate-binding protein [Alphaproteobacteria bacterium]|nr:carbohydrate ABC transporter substrate-binding protein [Alphaproteobacteria bacterium]